MALDKNNANENVAMNLDIEPAKKIIFDLLIGSRRGPEARRFEKTPDRVARMYNRAVEGYSEEPARIIKQRIVLLV